MARTRLNLKKLSITDKLAKGRQITARYDRGPVMPYLLSDNLPRVVLMTCLAVCFTIPIRALKGKKQSAHY